MGLAADRASRKAGQLESSPGSSALESHDSPSEEDLLLAKVPAGRRDQLVRPVRRLPAGPAPLAMAGLGFPEALAPWTGLEGARAVDFPLVLDPALWLD